MEANPALLGVGYIIGTRVSCIMVAGGVLAWFVLIPMIAYFGAGLNTPLAPATATDPLIRNMDADQIRSFYVLYIGAGAVAAGGIISMCRTLPLIVSSIYAGLRDMRASAGGIVGRVLRTDHDLSMRTVFFGCLVLIAGIWAFLMFDPQGGGGGTPASCSISLAAAVLIVIFGFLFVVVSARLTGEIGSSSNPISGMTVATLLLTCLIFFFAGWTTPKGPTDRPVRGGRRVHRLVQRRHHRPEPQDGLPRRRHAPMAGVGDPRRLAVLGLGDRRDAAGVELRRHGVLDPARKRAPLEAAAGRLEAAARNWPRRKARTTRGAPRRAIPRASSVESTSSNDQGQPAVFVDPGINGQLTQTDDGKELKGRLSRAAGRIVRLDYPGHPQP